MRLEDIPTPIRILPTKAGVKDCPRAKRKAPEAPIIAKDVMMTAGTDSVEHGSHRNLE